MFRRTAIVLAIVGCGSSPSPPPAAAQADPPKSVEQRPSEDRLPEYVPPPDPPYVPPPSSTAPPPAADQAPDASDEKACKARGGKIERVCMMGAFECIVRHRDAGKRCSDGKECSSGKCVYEGRQPAAAHAAGACQRDNNPCGCRAFVVGGQVQPTLCAD